ncbi:NUDIX domain-containing protein [bacterium]|nr:NUDIX domain-containing protein [bacterium]
MRYCSQCAGAMGDQPAWPKRCPECSREFFRNPTPVAVVIVPVESGVLTVRRAIPPRIGQLALPGGFVNFGESWQEAGCREVLEETNLVITPEELTLLELISVPEGNLLIFCRAQPRQASQIDLSFRNEEVSELVVLTGPEELAFPTHTQMLARAFT